MIVTRRRKKRRSFKGLMLPLLVIGAIVAAVEIPYTHKLIFDGPLKPQMQVAAKLEGKYVEPLLAPYRYAVVQSQLRDRARKVAELQASLDTQKRADAEKTQQLSDLRRKVSVLDRPASANAAPAPNAAASPSPDLLKTAAYWANMDPENAASVIQKLEPEETARIFAIMTPDQVGEIMNVLPADYNAKLEAIHVQT